MTQRMARYTSSHWGIQEIAEGEGGVSLKPFSRDPNPSPIGAGMLEACTGALRVRRPAVRRSVLEQGVGAAPALRGGDDFMEVDWDVALDLAARALKQTIASHGNEAIFGGSYGWASAGRFHHAQSQVHRFLNCAGGYVRHADTYSLGAGRVLLPHIVAPMDELMQQHSSWDVLERHTQLFVSFGGVPSKNAQISAGGTGEHLVDVSLRRMARAGVEFINVSPVANDIETGGEVRWLPIRPGTDTAFMLALAHTLVANGWHDLDFLATYCVGFERFERYVRGVDDGQPKDAAWAQGITGVPAVQILALAERMKSRRTMLNIAWSLQRSHHGEQPFWMLVTLAAMLGQIGLPGGGFGVGYGATGTMGNSNARFGGPTLPQGENRVRSFIPVARITDMLEHPGESFDYNGREHHYPAIKLIYWAGGNPFHHHQDLGRLLKAWRRVPHVIVHEQFWNATARLADIVLPATTTLERDDIGFATLERYMVAMKRAIPPVGQARDDYAIFQSLAQRLGFEAAFTEGRTAAQWLRWMYDDCRPRAASAGVELPPFDAFWDPGLLDLGAHQKPVIMLERFRADPVANPLKTPSGRIEIFSATIDSFGYADCAGHAQWQEPAEWLGSAKAKFFPLHLLSDQPHTKLHSQLDHSRLSRSNKVAGREPVTLHPHDARQRGISAGDIVRLWNDRGACLAGAVISAQIAPGVAKLSTGAWFDPQSWADPRLDKHGNPNALTLDIGASRLSQGCAAQTCLVEIEKVETAPPPVSAFDLPKIVSQTKELHE
jgi:biotin/methionine sulfoxide reductase